MIKQLQFYISGRVQSVGFRFFTHQQAKKLGIVGYVKNLDNGDVEIVAQGDSHQIDQLSHWLDGGGPTSAKITRITRRELLPQKELTSFNVRY